MITLNKHWALGWDEYQWILYRLTKEDGESQIRPRPQRYYPKIEQLSRFLTDFAVKEQSDRAEAVHDLKQFVKLWNRASAETEKQLLNGLSNTELRRALK